jgi:hypothetical protein
MYRSHIIALCCFVLLLVLHARVYSGFHLTANAYDSEPFHRYTATPPVSIVIPVKVQDNGGASSTVYFGVHSSATYCLDANLGEVELPPPPPIGAFEVRLVNPRGYDSCTGEGQWLDLRPYVGTQTDTFLVKFQPSRSGGYPITFSWSPNLGTYFSGSVMLKDLFSGIIVNVDMKAQTSYSLTLEPVNSLFIIASNPNNISNGPIVQIDRWNVGATSATLFSQIVPNGRQTFAWFEWGTTDSLEHATPYVDVGNSETVILHRDTVKGLLPNTMYHFRAAASNSSGTAYGMVYSFMTADSGSSGGGSGHIEVPLFIRNNDSVTRKLTFGFDPAATRCIDTQLGEYEYPPSPPAEIFDARFIDPRGFSECMGVGIPIDYRPFPPDGESDTFLVKVQPGNTGYPLLFHWSAGLDAYFSRLHLVDLFGGIIYNVDMLTTTSLLVTNSAIDKLYILAFPKPFSGVPPTVITKYAEVLSPSSARLHGIVSTNGSATEAWFEWGTSPMYGHATPMLYFDDGIMNQPYSTILNGLLPNTTYHFRAVARNISGTSYGDDHSFITGDNRGNFISVPLIISDSEETDSLFFGVHPEATFCTDTALGEYPLPPVPPTGVFDVRFVNPRGENNLCFDQGLKVDLRPLMFCLPEPCTLQVDTYLVRFQPSLDGERMMFVRWPDLHPFYGGPVILQYRVINEFPVVIDMMEQNSAVIPTRMLSHFTIIAANPLPEFPPPPPGEGTPFIYSVRDVPFDQGGRVSVRWSASSFDVNEHIIPFYSIWRATPEFAKVSSPLISLQDVTPEFKGPGHRLIPMNGHDYAWEFVGVEPAHQFTRYAFTAPTLYDSMAGTDGKHYFLVSAHTYDPNVFYDSNVDSGYSVDNLRPQPPRNLRIGYLPGFEGDVFTWNSSPDEDVAYYLIFYSETQNFEIESAILMGQSTDTIALSPGPSIAGYFAVCAQDIHGNLSDKSNEVGSGVDNVATSKGVPDIFALSQNYPNPFNPSTTFSFDLPQEGFVVLKIFNPLGQEVRTLVNSHFAAGRYSVDFDGTGLQSGVYFYQLTVTSQETGSILFRDVKKFLLLK